MTSVKRNFTDCSYLQVDAHYSYHGLCIIVKMQVYSQAQTYVSKHRCKADIIAIILEAAASGGTTKAKIYYRSFMTYQRLKGYLLLLEENGLIEYWKEGQLYKTTTKGIHALQAYNAMRDLIEF